jgi:hypothetical protein
VRGSLAVWCEASHESAKPAIDLHFNLWRDLPGSPDVLDVGFNFQHAHSFNRLHFFIPAVVDAKDIQDLSAVLEDAPTLSAVFNDTLTVGKADGESFDAVRGSKVEYRIARINFEKHLSLREVPERAGSGTVITLNDSLFQTMPEHGNHYVRLRVKLRGNLARVFSDDFDPHDRIFLSGFFRTDVVEFRVNEKRNFGQALRSLYPDMQMPVINAIHYFLVRSIAAELVTSHADFRKVRRLEPLLWDRYLEGLGSVSAEKMVIYHWRAGVEKSVEDFIALAWFRAPRQNLILYLCAILLLGAAGSTTQALLTKLGTAIGFSDSLGLQITILILLVFIILAGYAVVSGSIKRISAYHLSFSNGVTVVKRWIDGRIR